MKLALFGGSFDPVHKGHLHIAGRAREKLALDRVVFIPCRRSPCKDAPARASAARRLDMLRLAIRGLPWARADDFELRKESPSYSWETAEEFSGRYPESGLHWIIGGDQWEQLSLWQRPGRLASLVTFIVHQRHDDTPSPREGCHALFIKGSHPASSTLIRQDISQGRKPEWLPPQVAAYIRENVLYTH